MATLKFYNKAGQLVELTGVNGLRATKSDGTKLTYIAPSGKLNITDTAVKDVTNYAQAQIVDANLVAGNIRENVSILGITGSLHEGITPTGNVNITDLQQKNVSAYATAQIVDANLVAENIKKGVTILGITGTHEGGGSSGPTNYVTFTAQQAMSSVKIKMNGALSPITLFYSRDNTTWQPYIIDTEIWLTNAGDYVSFYGVGNWRATYSSSNYLYFVMSGKIAGSGDCHAILDAYTDATVSYGCYNMFYYCSALTQAPELPATKLSDHCYAQMFFGCTSLTQAPELPATTLVDQCYYKMFSSCYGLTQAPALPATTLAKSCYAQMFKDCTHLTQAPALPATTLASYCYSTMFNNCVLLTEAPELPATTLENYCYENMFFGCSRLTSVKTAVTTWNTSRTTDWLASVASSGTVYCPSGSTIPSGSTSGIPTGWSRVDWTPVA